MGEDRHGRQLGQLGGVHQSGEAAANVHKPDMTNRRTSKQLVAPKDERACFNDHGFDKAPMESLLTGHAAERGRPSCVIPGQERRFPIDQLVPSGIVGRQPSQGNLNSNEFAAGVVPLVQPIRENKPWTIVVRLGADALHEPFFLRAHAGV